MKDYFVTSPPREQLVVINYEEGNWLPISGWFYQGRSSIQFLKSRNTWTHGDIDLRRIRNSIEHNNKYSGSESLKGKYIFPLSKTLWS